MVSATSVACQKTAHDCKDFYPKIWQVVAKFGATLYLLACGERCQRRRDHGPGPHHPPPNSDVANLHADIRAALRGAALFIAKKTPAGREQSLALTHIETAMFWANAAIARGAAMPVDEPGESVAPSA